MANLKLPYTETFVERGKTRWRVRVKVNGKFKKRTLKKEPGTPEFMQEYQSLLAELRGLPDEPVRIQQDTESLDWLISQYFQSGEFYELADATQIDKRSTLHRIAIKSGEMKFKDITRADIIASRDARRETPAAANKFVKHMKGLYAWAIDRGIADINPAKEVSQLRMKNRAGHHTWTREEIARFRETHAVGTTARMAMELHYASLRASDVVKIGRQNIKDGSLDFVQTKTKDRAILPVHDELADCIAQAPRDALHLIQTSYGKPFSSKGYSARFKRWCKEAGLPDHCTSHGLRKALGAQLGENGATELEIAASLGQRGTQSVKHYTIGADRKRLAQQAGLKRN